MGKWEGAEVFRGDDDRARRIDVAPLIVELGRGQPLREGAHAVELGGDRQLSGLVEVAELLAQLHRGEGRVRDLLGGALPGRGDVVVCSSPGFAAGEGEARDQEGEAGGANLSLLHERNRGVGRHCKTFQLDFPILICSYPDEVTSGSPSGAGGRPAAPRSGRAGKRLAPTDPGRVRTREEAEIRSAKRPPAG